VRQFWRPHISGRHSAPKVIGAAKLEALIFFHAVQIAAWLRRERVSLHVKSAHFHGRKAISEISLHGKTGLTAYGLK